MLGMGSSARLASMPSTLAAARVALSIPVILIGLGDADQRSGKDPGDVQEAGMIEQEKEKRKGEGEGGRKVEDGDY